MTSCTQLAHLSRSVILRVSPLMVHCHCSKGKQRQLRESGFDFAIPRKFVTLPFDWWEAAKPSYLSLSASQRRELGLVYDQIKLEPLAWEATLEAARAAVRKQLADQLLCRRVLPTLAMLLGLDPQETVALSDWQLKADIDKKSLMPLRYSSARYQLSVRTKLLLVGTLSRAIAAGNATTWESLGIADWKDHMAACVQSVDEGMTSDVKSEWTSSSRRFVLRPARNVAYQDAPLG